MICQNYQGVLSSKIFILFQLIIIENQMYSFNQNMIS